MLKNYHSWYVYIGYMKNRERIRLVRYYEAIIHGMLVTLFGPILQSDSPNDDDVSKGGVLIHSCDTTLDHIMPLLIYRCI